MTISDSGTVAVANSPDAPSEIRADGKYRTVPLSFAPTHLHYSGDLLLGWGSKRWFSWNGSQATESSTLCDGDVAPAASPDTRRFACSSVAESGRYLHLYEGRPRTLVWSGRVLITPRSLALSDDGTVFLSDKETVLLAVRNGTTRWSRAGDYRVLAYDLRTSELSAFHRGTNSLDFVRPTDGSLLRQVGGATEEMAGPMYLSPGLSSWLVVRHTAAAPTLTHWDAIHDRALATWSLGSGASKPATSPSGGFAAVWDGRIQRVDVRANALLNRPKDDSSEPETIQSSRSGDRLAVVYGGGRLSLFSTQDGKELVRGEAPAPLLRVAPLAFSPDDRKLAVANRLGGIHVRDARTLQEHCRGHDARATWLYWSGNLIVAVYMGNDADDEQYRGGSVRILDTNCRVQRRADYRGLVSVLRESPLGLDLLVEGYVEPPWAKLPRAAAAERVDRAVHVDFAKGTLRDAAAGTLARLVPSWRQRLAANNHRVDSLDGSTMAARTERGVGCLDVRSGVHLAQYTLPKSAFRELAIAADGRWFAVPDGPSILIYPCHVAPAR